MTSWTVQWSELFPEGRWIFFEGTDPQGFANEMAVKYDFDPRVDDVFSEDYGWRFFCPASALDEVYTRYPCGS